MRKTIDQARMDLLNIIDRDGWAVMNVMGDAKSPNHSYTVGLWKKFHHPEIVMLGFQTEIMHRLLNDIGKKVRAGELMPVDVPVERIIQHYPVYFKAVEVAAHRGYFSAANWFYAMGGQKFQVLQCFLPDANGRFPWDEDVAPSYRKLQPILA